jgi:hypothetical protein
MKYNLHEIIDTLSLIEPVTTPGQLSRFVLDRRHTRLFKIFPSSEFTYGIIDNRLEGAIGLKDFTPVDDDIVYYTFGLKYVETDQGGHHEETDLTVIVGMEGYTIMHKVDAKSKFDFIEDKKVEPEAEDLLLKTIEVYCK